jgi:hypothetical protein
MRCVPPAAATAKVCVTDELCTNDLRALRGIELRASVELHKDKLHSSKSRGDIALKTHIASVFQLFQRYVTRVSYRCCKSRSGCYISLYTYVANVCPQCFICFFIHILQVCFIQMLHIFHTYVASVSFGCCVCFAMDTHVFFLVFKPYVASVSIVSDACCKCFIQMLQK